MLRSVISLPQLVLEADSATGFVVFVTEETLV